MTLRLLGTPDVNRLPPPKDLPTIRDDLDLDNPLASEPIPTGPPGLVNLGNTCYMNATVQCLNAVPPLSAALRAFRGNTTSLINPAEKIAASLRDVTSRLRSRNSANVNPMTFLAVLRQVNPQFAERANNGLYMQQDAEECWGEILTRLASSLNVESSEGNHVDKLFAFEMRGEDRCEESDEVVERKETVRALKCHISLNVNQLKQGVSEGLEETIEKTSDKLERSAPWKRTNRMHTLPPFLCVQFVRFFWKPNERVKAKILRNVQFPVLLDLYDFCTSDLQEKLKGKREEARKAKDEATEEDTAKMATEAPDDVVVQPDTGHYELFAVLTHQGRTADSGHYVAWVKDSGKKWWKFDDEKVSTCTEEDIKKLSGGANWHMAYMALYRAKNDA